MLSHGAIAGWATTAMPILSSNDTPLESGPMPTEEISWIGRFTAKITPILQIYLFCIFIPNILQILGSINSIGGILGTIAIGYIVSLLGSKRAILFLTLPEIAFWVLIYYGNHYYYILVARVLSGFTGAGLVPIVLYLSEIANDE